jgi:hypothetical protein
MTIPKETCMIATEDVVSLEKALWTNNPVVYKATILPEAVLVFAETGRISRDQAVEAIEQENAEGRQWAEVAFADVRVSPLVTDAVLLQYRATGRWKHQVSPIAVLASSVYVRRDNEWKLAFHQQTDLRRQ